MHTVLPLRNYQSVATSKRMRPPKLEEISKIFLNLLNSEKFPKPRRIQHMVPFIVKTSMEDNDDMDIYTVEDKTYIDLNPANWIEISDHEIAEKFSPNNPKSLEICRTVIYNLTSSLKIDKLNSVNFNKKC